MSVKELIDRYGTTKNVKVNGVDLPIINIPMMSDEKWQKLARENAVSNYRRITGTEPESVEAALLWQRERVAQHEREVV